MSSSSSAPSVHSQLYALARQRLQGGLKVVMHDIVFQGGDHGAFELRQELRTFLLDTLGCPESQLEDVGVPRKERCDYPVFAQAVGRRVVEGNAGVELSEDPRVLGVLTCGTGIGISIAANKLNGVRCGLCSSEYDAVMTRQHNNANVLALGGRNTGPDVAKQILASFIASLFEGGRHADRVAMIRDVEVEQRQ